MHLRIRQQNESALAIAHFLDAHPKVAKVFYPDSTTHENHDIARRQMSGFGGVLSFALHGGFDEVKRFLPRLRYVNLAANLGAVETVAGPPQPRAMSNRRPEERAASGIPEALIRYSVGIEDTEDLIADLRQALDGGPGLCAVIPG